MLNACQSINLNFVWKANIVNCGNANDLAVVLKAQLQC